jgi:hypothetical protein
MPKTPNHDYNVPSEGDENWHQPLNENFEAHDTDIEIRDQESNTGDYKPKAGAKFFATDTGTEFVGTGSNWRKIESSGPDPSLDSVSTSDGADLGGYVSVNGANRLDSSTLLGIEKQVSGNGFGGMTIETTGSGSGRPYLGYMIDGAVEAAQFYNAATGNLDLSNNPGGMRVSETGGIVPYGSDPPSGSRTAPRNDTPARSRTAPWNPTPP